jgi:hypothetical protein
MIQRRTICVSNEGKATNTNSSSFTFQFDNINFVPDEVIVRNVCFSTSSANQFVLWSDLVNDFLFATGAITATTVSTPETYFRPLGTNSLWTFSFRDTSQTTPKILNGAYTLFFQLEFVKYNYNN